MSFLFTILTLIYLSFVPTAHGSVTQFQVGEEWSRIFHDGQLTGNENLNKLLKATARIDTKDQRGTAFYLGKYAGKHLMMTNYHVLSDREGCKGRSRKTGVVYFQHINVKFHCGNVIARFKDLEITFFSILVRKKEEYLLEGVALPFDFLNKYDPGHKLMTAGYGSFRNSRNHLTYEISETCLLATSTHSPRLLRVKAGDKFFNAWSFAHACEISPSDSGSALLSASTGKVIGINWSTSTQKPKSLKNSSVVIDWVNQQNPAIWEGFLSYAVPNFLLEEEIRRSEIPVLNEFLSANLLASSLQ